MNNKKIINVLLVSSVILNGFFFSLMYKCNKKTTKNKKYTYKVIKTFKDLPFF
uniref:Uncharacterized protein n=1 Tax=viral metagenome TaxID=1070528 RepID=A0A6C0BP54_9ZZZZ